MRMDGNLDRYLVECTARCLEEIEQNKRRCTCVYVYIYIYTLSEHILNVNYADVRKKKCIPSYIYYVSTRSNTGTDIYS